MHVLRPCSCRTPCPTLACTQAPLLQGPMPHMHIPMLHKKPHSGCHTCLHDTGVIITLLHLL